MMSEWLERGILSGLLLAVCLSPWLFGSVENHAIDALGLLLILLLALWALKILIDREIQIWLTPVHVCLVLFLGVALAQLVPLPWAVRRFPIVLPAASGTLLPQGWNHLTLDVSATARASIKFAILLGYFLIAAQFLGNRRWLNFFIHALVILGFTLALVGILNRLTFNGKILWFRATEFSFDAFGPFVNRNHFAGFVEMLTPLPLAMILARGVGRQRWIFYGFCGVFMASALVYSLSRGGLLSLITEFLLLPFLAQPEIRQRRHLKEWERESIGQLAAGAVDEALIEGATFSVVQAAAARIPSRSRARLDATVIGRERPAWLVPAIAAALVSSAIALGVVWVGAEPFINRLSSSRLELLPSEGSRQSRPAIWRTALMVFREYPIWGAGLGAFPRAYTMVESSPGVYSVGEAHNDYLQVLSDTGLVGGSIGVIFLGGLAHLARRALRRPEELERGAALGATVGICGILVHSLVDFNLQITSNALLFLVLVAVLASSELRSRQLVEAMRTPAWRYR